MRRWFDNPPLGLFWIITLFWSVSMILAVVWPGWTAPTSLHALMMLAAGWAFGKGMIRKRDNGDAE